jgi:hypothetical protein
MWANKSICSYSDFNLAYVAEFQNKAGYAKKKTGRHDIAEILLKVALKHQK